MHESRRCRPSLNDALLGRTPTPLYRTDWPVYFVCTVPLPERETLEERVRHSEFIDKLGDIALWRLR